MSGGGEGQARGAQVQRTEHRAERTAQREAARSRGSTPPEPPGSTVLARMQRGLEALYRATTGVAIADFVVDDAARDALVAGGRAPREQLLVAPDDDGGGVSIGLYVDRAVLAHLDEHDPARALDDRNAQAFLYAIEGVSHFVYTVWCAQRERTVSALELELQAEIDKWVTCLLVTDPAVDTSAAWRRRLYGDAGYEPDLDPVERDRYRAANDNAARYARWLEERYIAPRRIPELLAELRRFWRLPLAAKLAVTARAA